MKISTSELLDELKDIAEQHLHFAEILSLKPEHELNFRPSQESWSTLECLEHLNRYGNFYIPEITNRIAASKTSPKDIFKSGILGNYFAKSMLPKENLNKMKTFKTMNPIHSQLNKRVVDEFISQQKQLLELLEKAHHIDLGNTKTSISISKLIKLKLGDTFRFVIYHNVRHIEQIKRILTYKK
ncbi:DinB family protein [Chryseobacterium sediminis]|uniref:DinB family protein n=1 Tax=Chryseobacterium sediminis TaxID=1679494 RepID=A0A5B2U2Q8_9FLAO|nr:DinB family protein [Chryseobacterium sediminis]KAA2220702.1 DinB family protein [Chryseobacterium sediminis]